MVIIWVEVAKKIEWFLRFGRCFRTLAAKCTKYTDGDGCAKEAGCNGDCVRIGFQFRVQLRAKGCS